MVRVRGLDAKHVFMLETTMRAMLLVPLVPVLPKAAILACNISQRCAMPANYCRSCWGVGTGFGFRTEPLETKLPAY